MAEPSELHKMLVGLAVCAEDERLPVKIPLGELRELIAVVRAAERERCARVADGHGCEGDRLGKEYACKTASEIAARIRDG